jgi:calcineurin-like phosphoesterase family protein
MSIYFTSDTHFGAERTLKFSDRPFETVKEMDSYIVDRWNEIISPLDTVYHLGDFGDLSMVDYLNGTINLVKGNYEDNVSAEELKKCFNNVRDFEVVSYNVNSMFILAHKPSDCVTLLAKYRGDDVDTFGLFGHIHGMRKVMKWGYDVGVDANHFRPVTIQSILLRKNAIENDFYDNEVWAY